MKQCDPDYAPEGFIAVQATACCEGCFFFARQKHPYCSRAKNDTSYSCLSWNRDDRTSVIYIKRALELPEDL